MLTESKLIIMNLETLVTINDKYTKDFQSIEELIQYMTTTLLEKSKVTHYVRLDLTVDMNEPGTTLNIIATMSTKSADNYLFDIQMKFDIIPFTSINQTQCLNNVGIKENIAMILTSMITNINNSYIPVNYPQQIKDFLSLDSKSSIIPTSIKTEKEIDSTVTELNKVDEDQPIMSHQINNTEIPTKNKASIHPEDEYEFYDLTDDQLKTELCLTLENFMSMSHALQKYDIKGRDKYDIKGRDKGMSSNIHHDTNTKNSILTIVDNKYNFSHNFKFNNGRFIGYDTLNPNDDLNSSLNYLMKLDKNRTVKRIISFLFTVYNLITGSRPMINFQYIMGLIDSLNENYAKAMVKKYSKLEEMLLRHNIQIEGTPFDELILPDQGILISYIRDESETENKKLRSITFNDNFHINFIPYSTGESIFNARTLVNATSTLFKANEICMEVRKSGQ